MRDVSPPSAPAPCSATSRVRASFPSETSGASRAFSPPLSAFDAPHIEIHSAPAPVLSAWSRLVHPDLQGQLWMLFFPVTDARKLMKWLHVYGWQKQPPASPNEFCRMTHIFSKRPFVLHRLRRQPNTVRAMGPVNVEIVKAFYERRKLVNPPKKKAAPESEEKTDG